jgi:flagellar hook-associated protein 2
MDNFDLIGGPIDVKKIVSSIMEVEKLPLVRMNKLNALYDYKLGNYDKLAGLIGNFSTAVDNLPSVFNTNTYQLTSSNDSIVSAVLTGSPISAETHQISITQLAQANEIASDPFSSNNSALSISENVTIQTGTNSFTLTVNPTDTLENIRDNINNSGVNNSVTAAILSTTSASGTPEYRLVLTSKNTGLANQMIITGDGPGLLNISNQLAAAQDAQFTFDGFNATRSSNTVSDLLDGITFTLNASTGIATLTVSPNSQNRNQLITSAVSSVFDAYNSIISLIDLNQSTKATRDSIYPLIKMQLDDAMQNTFGNSSIMTLLDLNVLLAPSQQLINTDDVEYTTSGQLVFDPVVFNNALNNSFNDVTDFFTNTGSGFVSIMDQVVTNLTGVGSTIYYTEENIQQQQYLLNQRIDREEERLYSVKERLTKQYSDLKNFVTKYDNMKKYLEMQLKALTYVYKK